MNQWLVQYYIWVTENVYDFSTPTGISFSHTVLIKFFSMHHFTFKTYPFYCRVCPSGPRLHLPLASSFHALSKTTSGRIKITKFLLLL